MKLCVAVIVALALTASVGAARADLLSFNFSPLENLEPFRANPTPYLGAQPWLTVTISTNWSPTSPTKSATTGTLTITPGSGWVSGETLSELGLNVLSSLTPSTFKFNGNSVSSVGLDTGGTFNFGFGPLSASQSYTITSTSSFWNAASFLGMSSGGSVTVNNVNYGPYFFYSEAILSNDLYIYASSYAYSTTPEPSRLVGILGMAIIGSLGMCIGFLRSRKPVISCSCSGARLDSSASLRSITP